MAEAEDEKINPCNLIVNYIPPNMTEHELASLFSCAGEVKKTKIVRDRATGISLGFGFVEYHDQISAVRAVDAYDGLEIQSKRLKVAFARRQEGVGANVHVRNLDRYVSARDVEHEFGAYGEIVRARVLNDPQSGMSRGIAFVLFARRAEAEKAVENLNGAIVPGFATSPLCVRFALDHKTKCQAEAASSGIVPGIQFPTPPHPILAAQAAATEALALGTGYGASLGGGPVRGNIVPRQRFNPLAGGNGILGQVPSTPAARLASLTGANPMPNATMRPGLPVQAGFVIFVYNLGQDSDDRDLWQLFGPFGAVQKVNIILDAEKKSKGYGFVTMTKLEEAANAINHLNGYVYKDRQLQVSLKTPKR